MSSNTFDTNGKIRRRAVYNINWALAQSHAELQRNFESQSLINAELLAANSRLASEVAALRQSITLAHRDNSKQPRDQSQCTRSPKCLASPKQYVQLKVHGWSSCINRLEPSLSGCSDMSLTEVDLGYDDHDHGEDMSVPVLRDSETCNRRCEIISQPLAAKLSPVATPRKTANARLRPHRSCKLVQYKALSLRSKMRRKTAKLADAVGENVLINYTVSPNNPRCKNNKMQATRYRRKVLQDCTNKISR